MKAGDPADILGRRWEAGGDVMHRVALFAIIAALGTVSPQFAAAQPEPPDAASSAALSCEAGAHRVRIVNLCPYPIWLAEIGSATNFCTSNSDCQQSPAGIQSCAIASCSDDSECPVLSCTTASDCPTGQQCTSGQCVGARCDTATNSCFCNAQTACAQGGQCMGSPGSQMCQGGLCTFNPIPPRPNHPNSWKLGAKGRPRHATTMCLPQTWSGRFWGRTQCKQENGHLNCVTGQCGAAGEGTGACTVSANGVTLFEPTLDAPAGPGKTVDYYDVSLGTGYNVPVAVHPSVASCPITGKCGSDLNKSCPSALQVTGDACTQDSDCKSRACNGSNCVVGCLDPCDACKLASPPAALQCDTYSDLYCCTGSSTASCNLGSATCFANSDCQALGDGHVVGTCNTTTHLCSAPCTMDSDCGGAAGSCDTTLGQCTAAIVDCSATPCAAQLSCDTNVSPFSPNGICVPESNSCCGPYNPNWLTAASAAGGGTPFTDAFKSACPTAYSYQYDDPTSLFTCAPTDGPVNYKVVFCPGAS